MININKKDPVADAVMLVLQQEEKKRLILEPEIDETGFHKAAHAAKRANQNTFEFMGKKYPVTAKSHKEAIEMDENAFDYKSPRPVEPKGGSGVKLGSRYGGGKQKEKPEHEEPKDKMKKESFRDAATDVLSGEVLDEDDCVTPPQAKGIAKKEVGKHEKNMHHKKNEEIDVNVRTKDTLAGRIKTKQKDDITGDKVDNTSTKVRFHAGTKNEEYVEEDEKKLASSGAAVVKTQKPIPIDDKKVLKTKTLKSFKEDADEVIYDDLINEVMSKDATAGDYIHDFIHSKNPKFAGKSKAERKKQALAAYYAKKNEEYVEEDMKSALKKLGQKAHKALTGGSDEDQRKDLQRKMGMPQTGQKPSNEDVTPPKHYGGKGTEGAKFDLYMQKRKQDNAKNAPKSGSVVKEGRSPVSSQGMDTPFVTDAENKPLNNAKEIASKTMKRIKNEMLGKPGTSE
jgi:hypothetical protein